MQTNLPPKAVPIWRLQDAKAQFSAVVDCALRGVPQHVTRRGKEAVVIVSAQDFAALQHQSSQAANRPASLIEHLLAIPKEPTDLARLELQPREIDFS